MMAQSWQWSFTSIACVCMFYSQTLATSADTTSNQILYMNTDGDDCGREVQVGASTVYSQPGAKYDHLQECQITFLAERDDWKLMLKFDYIDIPDFLYNGVCTDSLHIYDSDRYGERPFKYAGGNNGACGHELPPVLVSTGRYISVYFRTDASGAPGKGFKFQITAFTDELDPSSCSQLYFYCATAGRCIESYLMCDRVEHCTDGEDEDDNGDSMCNPSGGLWELVVSLGVAGFVGIIVGGLVVLILLIVCIVCTYRRCGKTPGDTEHRQSIPSTTNGSIPQQQHVAKDGVAYHPVSQNAPVNAYNMQNALNNQAMHYGQDPGCYPIKSAPQQQQQMSYQHRPSYVAQQQAMEMQMPMAPMQHHNMGGGGPLPPVAGPGPVAGAYNYNSPFHMARGGPESHSYSSGYSSQQGPAAASGFQPMHTKPIISQRGYTPTSGSSRSSRSRSESSRGARGDNHQYHPSNENARLRTQPATGLQ